MHDTIIAGTIAVVITLVLCEPILKRKILAWWDGACSRMDESLKGFGKP